MSLKEIYGTELLRELCLAYGPSGEEREVASVILKCTEGCYDERISDGMHSVILKISARKKGSAPLGIKRLLLSSHMDEVGFIVNEITDEGYLRFLILSGSDTRAWKGRNVTVGKPGRTVKGYVGAKPIHLIKRDERDTSTPPEELYVDIGAKSREEAEKYVSVGDLGTYDSDFVRFGSEMRMIKAKAIDDRLGCSVMCDLVRDVWKMKDELSFDIFFAFTCKEELGLSGAACAAYKVDPDHALVFEATCAADIDGVPPHRQVTVQGKGGALSIMDRSTVYDGEFTEFLKKTAEEKKIPVQYKQYVSGGNDAGSIRKVRAGVKCAAVSAPVRYIHSPSCVLRESDMFAIKELALSAITELCK